MSIIDFRFEVETIKFSGSERKFIVKDKSKIAHESYIVKRFCDGFVAPKKRFYKSPCVEDSIEIFKKISNRTYQYDQKIPYISMGV